MMKITFFLLGLQLIAAVCVAQTFQVDSIPKQGFSFNRGWKWHLGDDSSFAKADFDDSSWQKFDPAKNMLTPDKLPESGIGWLRIHVKFSSAIKDKLITCFVRHSGASEVFLNGKLVFRLGSISKKKQIEQSKIESYLPTWPIITDSVQVIAIRYAFSRTKLIDRPLPFFRLFATPGTAESEKEELNLNTIQQASLLGVFFILGFLQLALYSTNRVQLSNLYFGLFLIAQSLTHLSNLSYRLILPYTNVIDPGVFTDIKDLLFIISVVFSALFFILGIYQHFNQPKTKVFYIVCLLTVLTIPTYIFNAFDSPTIALFVFGCLIPWIEIWRVGIISIAKRKRGAKLFTLVHSVLLITFSLYASPFLFPFLSHFLNRENYSFIASFLGIAVTISLLLTQERAETNQILKKQLTDLDTLNRRMLAQEQEKQQLLAHQNELLEQQVEARTAELKASQAQLIQKEKLASLGELTAGIAHEIQNPLNFVNNFSELSVELIEEAPKPPKGAKEDWIPQEAPFGGWMAFLDDLKQNLQKINHHGGRASSIVKGMLEHSRTTTGERQLTDINQLADEYLRLSYHGMKAKDNAFSADYELVTEKNLPLANVVPQEIGRVLLNLINNAFYAVHERFRPLQGDKKEYFPKITVFTKAIDNQVIIQVQDNGVGIPAAIKDKIFQPFFTTKSTGEGTGLGLSLSYDIITKGHGGTLEVETKEGEGTTFIVTLPL